MKKLVAQIMKFGVVGVIAFVIDYGLLALLTEAFGVNYLVSATISFTASVVFNYAASMRYVFTHKEGMSRRREFAIFVVLSVIGLGLNNGCMWAGVEFLGIHYLIVKIGATFIVMVWNGELGSGKVLGLPNRPVFAMARRSRRHRRLSVESDDAPTIKNEAGNGFRPRIVYLVPLTGFEPAAFCSGGRRSIP